MNYNNRDIEVIMDNVGKGIIYVNQNGIVELINEKAKEIVGITFENKYVHESGKLEDGDIVIIADNKLGEDDGDLSSTSLKLINIDTNAIKKDDMVIAIGVYGNKKIDGLLKYFRGTQLNDIFSLSCNYLGFNLDAEIDTSKRITTIAVNDDIFSLEYINSIGHMVIISGKTGIVKFYQAKGYTVRNEAIGTLLNGVSYLSKNITSGENIDVRGKQFNQISCESVLNDKIEDILKGNKYEDDYAIYEINKRIFLAKFLAKTPHINEKPEGVYLLMESAHELNSMIEERNNVIRSIEKKYHENAIKKNPYPKEYFENFVGTGVKATEVKYMAYKASKGKFNVLITGESGTGKSMLAHEIHRIENPKGSFIEVNCNAIAPSLFESELFGYVGGAFTGARTAGKKGYFEEANGGTLFLDEIGDIPLDIQVKLLYVLQNKTIYPVGSSKPVKVDVRIITATNRKLEEEVLLGTFRQDLYYRINLFPIYIPPFRERKEDIYTLINKILLKCCKKNHLPLKQISGGALDALVSYEWPGNVRELENVIERAVIICESELIFPEHLSLGSEKIEKNIKSQLEKEEKRIIEATLIKYMGDKKLAMEELEISRAAFYDKLKKYEIHI